MAIYSFVPVQTGSPRDFLNGTDFDRLSEGKSLGQELTRFASETPWNDQVSCPVKSPDNRIEPEKTRFN